MVVQIASADEFTATLKNNEIVVVDFFATWCGPCKVIAPKFEQFSQTYTKAKFIKVDVDNVPAVAQQASIRAMPTFQIYQKGEKVGEVVGADPRKLEEEIKKYAA